MLSSKASSDSASTRYEAARPFCVMRTGRCLSGEPAAAGAVRVTATFPAIGGTFTPDGELMPGLVRKGDS